jgi:phage tail protein X
MPKPRTAASPNAKYPGTTTYIAKKGDTIESIAAKAYGSETPEGRHAVIDANYSLREAHSAADRVIHPGQAYFIPWNPAENHTIVDFLKAAAVTQGRPIPYRYAWWQESNYVYEIWMTGSFVLVGVIWPALIRIMVGGGMGRMKGEDYDLTRFKGGRDFIRRKEAKKEMSTEDLLKLTELEESLKASLKAGAEAAPVAQAAPAPVAPQVVKLKGALATDTAPIVQTEEEKHYKGEFYPVELPEAKPTDELTSDKKDVKSTPDAKKPATPESKKT